MDEENTNKVIELEKRSIEELKTILHDNPDDVACLILEPIQGEGGDNHFRPEYFKEIKQLSVENDFLLIYDEVQTGIGITGKMWAHQHFCETNCKLECVTHCITMEPDIISFGKKTQCCGIFAGKRLDEIDDHVFKESSRINSTFGGNLVDMVRFTIYLEIMENENLVALVSDNGAYLLSSLASLQNEESNEVSNVRGKGLFCAFDLPSSELRNKLIAKVEEEGALILGCGHRSIRFRPHLNISKNEIDRAMVMIKSAMSKI